MADAPLSRVVEDMLERMKPLLGLDRWQIKVLFGPGDETAACSCYPEYRMATLSIDLERLQTGDELDELLAHELAHTHTWPISDMAEDVAIALAECAPESMRLALGKMLGEFVRRAEEETTTSVGRAYVTLFRRLWQTEADLAAVRSEMKALRKSMKDPA